MTDVKKRIVILELKTGRHANGETKKVEKDNTEIVQR
jgi:hypothetical protein